VLKPRGVTWESQRTAALTTGAPFHLATGRIEACQLRYISNRLSERGGAAEETLREMLDCYMRDARAQMTENPPGSSELL
jgi:hypothetical protein